MIPKHCPCVYTDLQFLGNGKYRFSGVLNMKTQGGMGKIQSSSEPERKKIHL